MTDISTRKRKLDEKKPEKTNLKTDIGVCMETKSKSDVVDENKSKKQRYYTLNPETAVPVPTRIQPNKIKKNKRIPTLDKDVPRFQSYEDGSWFAYVPRVFSLVEVKDILKHYEQVAFKPEKSFFGHPPARDIWWCGDYSYSYSGKTEKAFPMPEWMKKIQERVRILTEKYAQKSVPFSGSLNNRYADKTKSVDWHGDDERDLEPDMPITAVSFGGERLIEMKHNKGEYDTVRQMLGNASVYIMGGTCQHTWKHRIPKWNRSVAPRISATFRVYKRTHVQVPLQFSSVSSPSPPSFPPFDSSVSSFSFSPSPSSSASSSSTCDDTSKSAIESTEAFAERNGTTQSCLDL